jgi:CRISPR-associated protein Cas2
MLVCYDVRDPARLRRVHNTVFGFGDPLQYSVFLCDLSGTERVLLETAVLRVMSLAEDSLAIVDLGPASGGGSKRIQSLGVGQVPEVRRYTIV